MFNTTYQSNYQNNSLKINACSGGIYKSTKDSWFRRFHLNSSFANGVFKSESGIIVLQMVICGEMEVIAELMSRSDYEKMFNESESS